MKSTYSAGLAVLSAGSCHVTDWVLLALAEVLDVVQSDDIVRRGRLDWVGESRVDPGLRVDPVVVDCPHDQEGSTGSEQRGQNQAQQIINMWMLPSWM